MIPLHEDFGSATIKQANMARYITLTSQDVVAQLNAVSDYSVKLPAQPAAALITTATSLWDVANWDEGQWSDDDTVKRAESQWQSVTAQGTALAPVIQITIGGGEIPDIELVRIELNYQAGFVV
jgi:hypothetical protein